MVGSKKVRTFAPANERIATEIGALAQLVEHRTENPCVPGSIPGGTTPPFIMNPAKDLGLERGFRILLSHAKVGENGIKRFLRCDESTSDFCQMG